MGRVHSQLQDSQDFRFDTGRSTDGMFLRVVHLPTGKNRVVNPVGRRLRESRCTYVQLLTSLMQELAKEARHPPGEPHNG
jgi:hypothetical protein